jgi:hypothetical protein
MYQIELVEGKDTPTPNTQPHSDKGRTVVFYYDSAQVLPAEEW